MSGTVNIPVTVQALQGVPIPSATPADGDALVYNAATGAWTHKPAGGSVVNYVDNSGFTVNQRAYASGAALAAGAYGFDRWKAGAQGGTLTYTAVTGASNTVTITAGSILEVIEGAGLITGTYTLSWQGTAQGRIGNGNGGLSGEYAASPLQWAATAGTNVTIEFTNGTLGQVQMQLGSTATPWQPLPAAVEVTRCSRYFWTSGSTASLNSMQLQAYNQQGNMCAYTFALPVRMRAAPTMVITALNPPGNTTEYYFLGLSASTIGLFAIAVASGQINFQFDGTASSDL